MLSVLRLTMTGLGLALAAAMPAQADDGSTGRLADPPACAEASRLEPATASADVTATFYGVSTLMFSDGVDRVLIDGFVSRPSLFRLFSL